MQNVVGPNSEYAAARQLADHLKLDLKVTEVEDKDFLLQMPDVVQHYGHPFFRHPNSIPFIKVARLVRSNGIKAVLSGEGSDECYYGYPNMIFNLAGFLKHIARQPPTQMVR